MRNKKSRLRGLKEDILDLHKKGLSYRQIQEELNCSKGTIAYHLGKGQKEKAKLRLKSQRDNNIRYEENRWQFKGEVNPKHPLRKIALSKVA